MSTSRPSWRSSPCSTIRIWRPRSSPSRATKRVIKPSARLSTKSSKNRSAAAESRSTTGFVQRVVPEILSHAPELGVQVASDDLVPEFVKINSDLRKLNAAKIQDLTAASSPTRLWMGSFVPLGNAKVEAGFADHRIYLYKGKEIDRQVHLGFDLAVTTGIPVKAANAGNVLLAEWLGIYGNCIILDHGMGVASLYGHLSSIDVRRGDSVTRGQIMGRSGMTGLAGRRPSAFHDARQRESRQSGRVVGSPLDSGPRRAQAGNCRGGGKSQGSLRYHLTTANDRSSVGSTL